MTRDFDVLSKRMERREIRVEGTLTEQEATVVIAQLLYLDDQDPVTPIVMLIDSEGGLATAALALHDTMVEVRPPVFTSVDGMAGGMAILLAVAGTAGHRTATARSEYVFTPLLRPDGASTAGADVARLRGTVVEHLAKYTRIDRDAVLRAMERWDRFDAQEALRHGLVDELVVVEDNAAR